MDVRAGAGRHVRAEIEVVEEFLDRTVGCRVEREGLIALEIGPGIDAG